MSNIGSSFNADAYLTQGNQTSNAAPFNPDAHLASATSVQPNGTFMLHPSQYVSRTTDQPAEEGATPVSMLVGAGNQWVGGKLQQGARALGMTDPSSLRAVGNIPAALETVLPFAVGSYTRSPPGVSAQPHPLAQAAREQQANVEATDAAATAEGFDLPPKSISQPNQIVNRLGRQDLKLPTAGANGIDAPLTSDMLHIANKQYVSPAFQAVEQYPKPITLSPSTKATIEDVRPLLSPGEIKALPTADTITAQQGLNLSQTLRARANQIPDSGMNTTTNQMWKDVGKAHMDAARAIEGDMSAQFTSDGQGQLADDWNAARIYRAKSAAYEHSLDGAGNIRATDLKNQLVKQGVPLTDNAQLIANVAARHPELFKGAPATPQPGLLKKAAAAMVPWATTGAGAHLGGPGGAVAGEIVGRHLGEKLLGP